MRERTQMKVDASKYEYLVRWSGEDQEYVGTCLEFPSLSWLDTSVQDALSGIIEVVKDAVRDMSALGEAVPEPLSVRKYSGHFILRTSPQLHARLVREAAEHGLSLNSFANQKLATH
jgi:predicted HicB family RNase H-like nuclease